jgi:lysophospholipase L1-like esterase
MRAGFVKELVALGLGLLISIALAEGALRVYSAINSRFPVRAADPMAVEIEPHGSFGFRQRPNATFHYVNGTAASTNSMGYRGPIVPLQPAPGTTRIILFGGSASYGWGVPDDQTIDTHMRAVLSERYPSGHFEVINLAFDAYDSYQDLERLRSDGLGMHPSIVILNTGLNDVRNAWYPDLKDPDPRTLIWEAVLQRLRAEQANGGPTVWTRIKHYSLLARLPGYLREMVNQRREAQARARKPAATNTNSSIGASGQPPYPDAADYFERNVRRAVDLSTKAGASVLLSMPPSSIRSYPPDTTSQQGYWIYNARTTADYRDELSRRLVAIAADKQKAGRAVCFVAPVVPTPLFIDDAHLTGAGNRAVAESFIRAIAPFLTSGTLSDSASHTDARLPTKSKSGR